MFASYARTFEGQGSPAAKLPGVVIAGSEEHVSYITGAVVLSVAALEAFANDVFIEASDEYDALYSTMPRQVCAALRARWPTLRRSSLTEKLKTILDATRIEDNQTADEVLADVRDLIALRNALVHFKAEWEDAEGVHRTLEERLTGKFAESPYSKKEQAFFPHRCLSADCARWSLSIAYRAIETVGDRLGDGTSLKSESIRVRPSDSGAA